MVTAMVAVELTLLKPGAATAVTFTVILLLPVGVTKFPLPQPLMPAAAQTIRSSSTLRVVMPTLRRFSSSRPSNTAGIQSSAERVMPGAADGASV